LPPPEQYANLFPSLPNFIFVLGNTSFQVLQNLSVLLTPALYLAPGAIFIVGHSTFFPLLSTIQTSQSIFSTLQFLALVLL